MNYQEQKGEEIMKKIKKALINSTFSLELECVFALSFKSKQIIIPIIMNIHTMSMKCQINKYHTEEVDKNSTFLI